MARTDRPRQVLPAQLDRLRAWAGRKPRLALMGEFSSGKSTLLNLLIGADLLPTKVTATELPTVWFSHGPARAFWVDRQGGRHALDFGSFDGIPISARYVRVFTPAPLLESCDIIDTPGISDPNLEEDCWKFATGQANFILWCTSSTQAWRETERSTWMNLPERLRANSALVVTRSDKLSELDREKVARRLARESFGLFNGVVFLSALDAVRGKALLAEAGDASLWRRSGGADLDAKIRAGVEAVRAERADLLDRYASGPAAPRPPAEVLPLTAAMRSPEPEAVRPRRVELTEALRRTERPTAAADDPLGAIRASWRALREGAPETPAPEAPAAPVLRLTDPAPRPAPEPEIRREPPRAPVWAGFGDEESEEDDVPLLRAAPPPPRPEPAPALPVAEDDSFAAVLAAMAKGAAEAAEADVPVPPPAPAAPPVLAAPAAEEAPLPRAVRIWRDIVARSPEMPSNGPLVAMIDQLLVELSRQDQQSDGTGAKGATDPGRTWAA